ncbi:MAG: hypothetical protein ACI8UO_003312 [Verrucomicrobiales bacterium]|jgi:hypothetical protein
MGNFFPRWTNILPIKLVIAAMFVGAGAVLAVSYYWTPKQGRQGYMPEQPIPFDHSLHAGQLGMDCRYCHTYVEQSTHSNIPTAQTCMNCHQSVKTESEKLAPLREAVETGEPIKWVEVHHVPDYAYFNHQVHVNRGVSCHSCHGKVNEMPVVYHHETQSMSWCLDCHRAPENKLRPLNEVTNLDWVPGDTDREGFYESLIGHGGMTLEDWHNFAEAEGAKKGFTPEGALTQKEIGTLLKEAWGVNPPESCAACHR